MVNLFFVSERLVALQCSERYKNLELLVPEHVRNGRAMIHGNTSLSFQAPLDPTGSSPGEFSGVPDEECARLAQKGHQKALTELVHRYTPGVYNLYVRLYSDRDLAADSREFSKLRDVAYNELTGEMISDAAIRGDRIALEAFEYTGMFLGKALANAALYTSPEAFILFGGLANSKDLLFQPTLRYMEEDLMPTFKGTIRLLLSGLQDKNAAVLGTGALAWHQLQDSQK